MNTRRRIGLILSMLLGVGLMATTLTGCFGEEIYSGGDLYTCVLNTKTGKVVKELPSGTEDGYTLGDDERAYQVPTSNRFYNITANRANADDGAPAYLTGGSRGYRAEQAQVTVRFVFKQTAICDFVLKHVKRNDQDENGDFQFGARLDPNDPNEPNQRALTEWAIWLNENFAPALQKVGIPIWQQYEWENLEYNYPTNAQPDGTIPTDQQPGVPTWSQIETDLGKAFTAELNSKLGGEFFCGVGYSAQKPDECPTIDIDVLDVSLEDQAPVAERAKLDNQRDEQENARQAAGIAQATLDQKKAAADANAELRQLELQEAQANAALEAANTQVALEKKRAEALSDPEYIQCVELAKLTQTCPMIERERKVGQGGVTVNQGG